MKTLPIIFLHCFVFFCCCCFQEITHAKMQVFLDQPWQQMCASLIILFGKTKALFGKDAARGRGGLLSEFYGILNRIKRNKSTCKKIMHY